MRYVLTFVAALGCLATLGAQQQGAGDAKAKAKGGGLIRPLAEVEQSIKGKLERIKVHGKSLEGNLEGDSADREVFVYLPPSYSRDTNKRYPVVYMLHGYGLHAEQWVGFINVASEIGRAHV